MKSARVYSMVVIAASVPLAGVFGCINVTPPAEAVLEGTWELVPSDLVNPQLTHWYLTFDSGGELTRVRYTFLDSATVTWNSPPGSVIVNENQVHISATRLGNGLTFDGTLDSPTEPTMAAGSLTSNLVFGDIEISVSEGEAVLVKQ